MWKAEPVTEMNAMQLHGSANPSKIPNNSRIGYIIEWGPTQIFAILKKKNFIHMILTFCGGTHIHARNGERAHVSVCLSSIVRLLNVRVCVCE